MKEEFANELTDKLKKIDVEISSEQVNSFYEFMIILLHWNTMMNLTAITDEHDVILKHFVDSLTIKKYIESGEKIVDIGTGAGFPAIPLSIICNDCNFTLVDSLNKRVNFLNEVKEKIKLDNIENIHARAEEFCQNKFYREKFDVAVSRAVANLTVLAELLLPAVKVGGKVICMKGSNIEEELETAKFAIKELGGRIINIDELVLPDSDQKRNVIIIEKIKQTPKQYPRKPGMPNKQPLIK